VIEQNKIFDKSGCVVINALEDYSKGVLNQEEERLIEQHLATCEICSEIVDGLMLLNKTHKEKSISKINTRIDQIIQQKDNNSKIISINRKYYFAAAASLFIILISFFILRNLFNQNKEQLAEMQPKQANELIDSVKNLITEASKTDSLFEEGNSIKLKPDSIYRKGNAIAANQEKKQDILKELTKKSSAPVPEDLLSNTEYTSDETIAQATGKTIQTSDISPVQRNSGYPDKSSKDLAAQNDLAYSSAPARAESEANKDIDHKEREKKSLPKTKSEKNNSANGAAPASVTTVSAQEVSETNNRNQNDVNQSICNLIDSQNFKEAKILNDAALRTLQANEENEYFALVISVFYLGEKNRAPEFKNYFNPPFRFWQQAMLFWAYASQNINKDKIEKEIKQLLIENNSIYSQKARQYLGNIKD
jgi:hypothetical protein